jgi:hypothetical protein
LLPKLLQYLLLKYTVMVKPRFDNAALIAIKRSALKSIDQKNPA